MLAGGARVLMRLGAVFVGGGSVLLGLLVVALVVLVRRLVVVMLGSGVVSGRVQVMLGGGMLGGCHDSRSSLSGLRINLRYDCPVIPTKTPRSHWVMLRLC